MRRPAPLIARLVALVLAAPPALADAGAIASIDAARARLETAHERLAQAGDARDRVSALTETVHAYEDGLVAMREGLRRVSAREATLTRQLDAKSGEISAFLGTLQTMGRAPAPLLLLHPSGPLGTARGGMILSEVTPALNAQALALEADLSEVARLRALQSDAARTLQQGLEGASTARTALSDAVSERRDLPVRYADDPVQTALLVASSDTLAGLAQALGSLPEGTALPAPDSLRGELPPPVTGPLLRRFGQSDAADVTRPGVVIATRPRALVTVPMAATLRFRGPLLDYGTVAIIEPAADVLIVMAGLAEVFGTPGEVLPAGSPLGLMGGTPAGADAILTAEGGAALSESLYIEVRESGTPVDPADWFVLE